MEAKRSSEMFVSYHNIARVTTQRAQFVCGQFPSFLRRKAQLKQYVKLMKTPDRGARLRLAFKKYGRPVNVSQLDTIHAVALRQSQLVSPTQQTSDSLEDVQQDVRHSALTTSKTGKCVAVPTDLWCSHQT
jgi:hypothetical protein